MAKRLIDRFDQQSDQIRSPDYNETTIRIEFINPLFAVLGVLLNGRKITPFIGVLSAAMLILLTIQFSTWYWVS